MKAETFEDLIVWQKAKDLAVTIYRLTKKTAFAKDFGLRDQIQRAAVSVSSNIAEGFERNSDKEFVNFLFIAKGSCGEVRSQLRIAFEVGYLSDSELANYIGQCLETSKSIASLIKSIRTSASRGFRYKDS